MKELNLTDMLRQMHPRARDSFTGIDLFLLSTHRINRSTKSEYLSRILSDHFPLTLSIHIPEKTSNVYRWRLNLTLLQKTDFCKFIRGQTELFCDTNCPSFPNSFILWDTLKAFLRGQIISYNKGIKKKYMAEIEELEADILKLEKQFKQSKCKDEHQLMVNTNLRYNTLHTYGTEKNIMRTKQRYYKLGEKAHKILSWQLKKIRKF